MATGVPLLRLAMPVVYGHRALLKATRSSVYLAGQSRSPGHQRDVLRQQGHRVRVQVGQQLATAGRSGRGGPAIGARSAAIAVWSIHYNHHRPHSSADGDAPDVEDAVDTDELFQDSWEERRPRPDQDPHVDERRAQRLWLRAWTAAGASPSEGIFHRRDVRRQQCFRVLRDPAADEPQHAYLVLVFRFLVIDNVEEPVGTRGNHGHMLEQFDHVRRRAVIGRAAEVDERLAVHPPQIKQVRAVHLRKVKVEFIDDLPQPGLIVVIGCGLSDRDPPVVLKHLTIIVMTCFTVPIAA